MLHAPQPADIEAAAERIAPYIRHTPLLESEALNRRSGARLFLKAENLQRGGAFKARGAFSAVTALLQQGEAPRGLIAYSSGNHAIAVASAARTFGLPAVIVMPADAPAAKRTATEALGAEVVAYDRERESREAIGERLARERGLALIRPFDDPMVIAGQGTAGLEIARDLRRLGLAPQRALICASGGGLCAGVGLALRAQFPDVEIVAVEPQGHDDLARSLAAGERLANPPGVRSICDALLVERPGEITFPMLQALGARAVAVDDAAVLGAMQAAALEMKLVLEPGGAVALAAALAGEAQGVTVVVASGGNVDAPMLRRVWSQT
ncbi:MAG: threonine/serine dehydratase [Hyphomonadaceae bacterium]|nr:threonine/serine dehydratase [Hyphomonadaceae bacterium]